MRFIITRVELIDVTLIDGALVSAADEQSIMDSLLDTFHDTHDIAQETSDEKFRYTIIRSVGKIGYNIERATEVSE